MEHTLYKLVTMTFICPGHDHFADDGSLFLNLLPQPSGVLSTVLGFKGFHEPASKQKYLNTTHSPGYFTAMLLRLMQCFLRLVLSE